MSNRGRVTRSRFPSYSVRGRGRHPAFSVGSPDGAGFFCSDGPFFRDHWIFRESFAGHHGLIAYAVSAGRFCAAFVMRQRGISERGHRRPILLSVRLHPFPKEKRDTGMFLHAKILATARQPDSPTARQPDSPTARLPGRSSWRYAPAVFSVCSVKQEC